MIQGNLTDINATLASLSYTGNTNVLGTGADTLTVTTNDLGNSGSGGAQSDVDTVQIDITAVNDTPVVTGPGTAYSVNEQTNLNIHGSGFAVADVDAASGTMTAALTVGEGDIALTAGDSGVSIVTNNAGSVSFTATGAAAGSAKLKTLIVPSARPSAASSARSATRRSRSCASGTPPSCARCTGASSARSRPWSASDR